jgi:endoglucanase
MAGLFVDPRSAAMQAYNQLQSTNPAQAALIYQIASQPQAVWLYGDGSGMTAAEQATYNAASAAAYPVFVPYTLLSMPAPDYPAWIRDFAQVISAVDSAVVVEPNVLPRYLSQYASVISASVETLKASGKTRVYLDAGHAAWRPAAQMADTLNVAGIANADGFAINVGNFRATAECPAYGEEIAGMVGKPYIIDTGRNGNGPPDDVTNICNPPGRGLGRNPLWDPDRANYPRLDAYLWIKRPGESDGDGDDCHGGPPHGQWFEDYALALVNNRPDPQT